MTTLKSHSISGTGYYKGIFSFINDNNGVFPDGWTNQDGTGCATTVISNLGGHNKVLQMFDNSTLWCKIYQQGHSINIGTIELWIRTTDITKNFSIDLLSSAIKKINVVIDTSKWKTNCGGSYQIIPNVVDPINDTWHHIRIDFDCDTDLATIIIDDVSSGALSFISTATAINQITIYTNKTAIGYYVYIDAIGYSWYSNYNIGDNKTEYTNIIYKQAKTRRGIHKSYKDFISFDINKMLFPGAVP